MTMIDIESVREQMLKDGEWNISFSMSTEILHDLLTYYSKIPTADMPFFFFKDKMVMAGKSTDNVQFTEVVFGLGTMSDYECGLGKVDSNSSFGNTVSGDRFYDMAIGTTADELPLEGFDNEVTPEGEGETKKESEKEGDLYETLTDRDYALPAANEFGGECISFIIDAKGMESLLADLKKFKGKDALVEIRIDTKTKKRMELHLNQVTLWIKIFKAPESLLENFLHLHDTVERVRNNSEIEKGIVKIEPESFADICNLFNKGNEDAGNRINITIDPIEGLSIYATCDNKGFEYHVRENKYEYKPVDEKKKKKEELGRKTRKLASTMSLTESKEVKENKARETKQLLGLSGTRNSVLVELEFLIPYNTKALSPITMEIRTDKPVVLERIAYNDIKMMLSIAPRMENEEEKEAREMRNAEKKKEVENKSETVEELEEVEDQSETE